MKKRKLVTGCEWHVPDDLEGYVLPLRKDIVLHRTVDLDAYRDAAKRYESTRLRYNGELSWQYVLAGGLSWVAGLTGNTVVGHIPSISIYAVARIRTQLRPYVLDENYRGEEYQPRANRDYGEFGLPKVRIAKALGCSMQRLSEWRRGNNMTDFPQMDALLEGHVPVKLEDEIAQERYRQVMLKYEIERKWLYDKD